MPNASDRRPQKKAKKIAKAFTESSSFQNDPLGSYTGKNANPSEKPVQDADDL